MTAIAPALERPRRPASPLVLAAIGGSWALAVGAEVSGRAGALHAHGAVEGGAQVWAALLLFLLAWQAMVAAMMLPSSLPLIRLFDAASRKQERASLVRGAFLLGYAAVWTGFGAAAFMGDVGLHRAVDALPWLAERPWLVAGSVLALAGAFQFSDLKDRCLSKCRHPGPYLMSHYRRGASAGFRLGFGHGVFCLGCCWALMLVMFATGVAVLWWMAALTALMVYEKVGRHGAGLTKVAGIALLGAAVIQLAHPAWLPAAAGGPRTFVSRVEIGPGPVTQSIRAHGYDIVLHVDPNRATKPGNAWVKLSKVGRAVDDARVQTSFTMLDMEMGEISTRFHRTAPGTYTARVPALGMPGRWGLRVGVAPARGPTFTVRAVDRVAP